MAPNAALVSLGEKSRVAAMGTKPASKESRRWRDGVYFVPVIEPGQTGHVFRRHSAFGSFSGGQHGNSGRTEAGGGAGRP